MVGTNLKASLRQAVDAALAESDPDSADQKYLDVLQLVRMQVGDNETDIANALQTVAKELEDEGRKAHAFDFKQKTCIMLLEFTMTEMPPLPKEFAISTVGAIEDPLMKLVLTIQCVGDLELAKKHFSKALQAIVIDEKSNSICMRSAHGAMFLLVKGDRPGSIPAFEGLFGKENPVQFLDREGWKSEGTTFPTPHGQAQVYSHPQLGKLALIC